MKTLLTLMSLLLFVPTTALASDVATLATRGFTEDGARFVFEERGVSDGSGHAYANIYVINTYNDSWVEGTPIRIGGEGEGDSEWEAILKARQIFKGKGFDQDTYMPGNLVAGYPAAQRIVDKSRASFFASNQVLGFGIAYNIQIDPIPLQGPDYCAGQNIQTVGFRLRIGLEDNLDTVIAEDTKLPESRGCVEGYDIAEVRTYFPKNGPAQLAIIIAMRQSGFEGAVKIRHMAVTAPLPPY